MSDPRYDYFQTSVDKAANRGLVTAISGAVIAAVRPKEAIATPYVVGGLLDRAARGEQVRAGSDASFGLGGGDLLAYVVVPLVTELSAAIFLAAGVAGVAGLSMLPDPLPTTTPEEVLERARRSDLRMGRKEAAQVAVQINQLLRIQVQQTVGAQQTRPATGADVRCAPYRCARLRQIFTEHFSSEELRMLCFDLAINHEEVIIGPHSEAVRRLLEYALHRGRLEALVAAARAARHQLNWE